MHTNWLVPHDTMADFLTAFVPSPLFPPLYFFPT